MYVRLIQLDTFFLADLPDNFQYDLPLSAERDLVQITQGYPHMALSNRHKLPITGRSAGHLLTSDRKPSGQSGRIHVLPTQVCPHEVSVAFNS
jgi:hypothetical protein